MARIDSGHETVTSEEEGSITPKHSPVSMSFYEDPEREAEDAGSGREQDACHQCQLSSRRYPITCEKDLYRLPSCKHENSPRGNRSSSAVTYREQNNARRYGGTTSINTDVYADPTKQNPPRLTGTLNPGAKAIIRPIAFKPTVIGTRLNAPTSTPQLERYGSETLLQRNSNSRFCESVELSSFSAAGNPGRAQSTLDSQRFGGSLCNVLPSSNLHLRRNGSASTLNGEICATNSGKYAISPQDKWSNEMGFDKRQNLEPETKHLQAMYDVHLKAAQNRAAKLEHALVSHSCKLQQERRQLRTELAEAQRNSQQADRLNSALRQELEGLHAQLEDVEWALCHRAGEMALVKAQLKDSQGNQATRSHELVQLRSHLKDLATEGTSLRFKVAQANLNIQSKEREILALRQTLEQAEKTQKDVVEENYMLQQTLKEMELRHTIESSMWEVEKAKWVEEQKRVLRYQKALQHNYVVTCQKAQALALQVESLTGLKPQQSWKESSSFQQLLSSNTSQV